MTTVYLDLETGGVEPRHPNIQLAAIAVADDWTEVGVPFEQKIAFDSAACDHKSLEVNHYTAEAWADAVAVGVCVSRFSAWLRPHCCVERVSRGGNPYRVARAAGYNVATFDGPRLRAMFGTQFLPIEFLMRDVLQRALFWFDEHGITPADFKLATVAQHFGIAVNGAHDALVDVRLTAAVARAIKEAR